MLLKFKAFLSKVKEWATVAWTCVSKYPVVSILILSVGAVVTHTLLHTLMLSSLAIVLLNILHLLFIIGVTIVVLASINKLAIFDGKAKLMEAPTS